LELNATGVIALTLRWATMLAVDRRIFLEMVRGPMRLRAASLSIDLVKEHMVRILACTKGIVELAAARLLQPKPRRSP